MSGIKAATSIVVLGGGGHASDVLNVIERLGLLTAVAGFLDDAEDLPRMRRWGIPRLGALAGARLDQGQYVLGVGLPAVKARLLASLDEEDATAITLVDPGAMCGHGASLGAGTVVLTGGCVSALAVLGDHCLVGHNAIVGHDAVLGDRCSVMPGAAVSGDSHIGDDVLIGTNAAVREGITIGSGAIVGAGAVVLRDVSAGQTVVGVPARPISR